jgi:signal transduction histidine kinase/phage shock protein PspC (stress-responsive transcriptional regulator)
MGTGSRRPVPDGRPGGAVGRSGRSPVPALRSHPAIRTAPPSPEGAPPPPARAERRWQGRAFPRSADDRVLTGVAGGLGRRLGVDPLLVRAAFVLLAVAGGSGVGLYIVAWLMSHDPAGATAAPWPPPRATSRRLLALGLIVAGGLMILREVGVWFGDTLVGPLSLAVVGSALIWVRSDEGDRARWSRMGRRLPASTVEAVLAGPASLPRIAGGALLVVGGMSVFLIAHRTLTVAGTALLAVVVTAAGLGLILGPWIYRLARTAAAERRERIRSEERAEMAAHLHDSVLHTLALIQRAEAPPEVVSLARRQERELRAWLNGRVEEEGAESLGAAVDGLAARVEREHAVAVDAVVVGDRPVDERLRAVVLACQEAALNAARHSGAPRVSVYVEAEPEAITAYVRDQGRGFDPAAVPADRHGIAESIRGRILRLGGTAVVTSTPGVGTEVQLRVPVPAA